MYWFLFNGNRKMFEWNLCWFYIFINFVYDSKWLLISLRFIDKFHPAVFFLIQTCCFVIAEVCECIRTSLCYLITEDICELSTYQVIHSFSTFLRSNLHRCVKISSLCLCNIDYFSTIFHTTIIASFSANVSALKI